jgi:hypothetical protein
LKIGEIWKYKGNFPVAEDGRRWAEDSVDPYWYMELVRITDMFSQTLHGEMVAFEPLEGGIEMEAIFQMPKILFLKEYGKVYQ